MAVINGTADDHIIFRSTEADTINGFAGSDELVGDAGDNTLSRPRETRSWRVAMVNRKWTFGWNVGAAFSPARG
jgi:Ca2+-binding RTX toxin-like protein